MACLLVGRCEGVEGRELVHLSHHRHNSSSHVYEYSIRYAGEGAPSVTGQRLIRQETDARNWEFPQVEKRKRIN